MLYYSDTTPPAINSVAGGPKEDSARSVSDVPIWKNKKKVGSRLNIKTKEYKLTEKEFFKVLIISYFRGRWWLVVLLFLFFAVYEGYTGSSSIATFLALFAIIYPLCSVVYLWIYSNSKQNKIFFKKRYLEIDDNFLTGYIEDGGLDKIKFDNITKVIKTKKYYLIYISKNQFIYLSLNAFYSEQEINDFDSLLRNKKLI